jgi:hypothetical protein
VRAIRIAEVYASCRPQVDWMALGMGPKMCPNAEPRKQQETAKWGERPIRRNLSKRSETSTVRFLAIGIREGLRGRDAEEQKIRGSSSVKRIGATVAFGGRSSLQIDLDARLQVAEGLSSDRPSSTFR